MIITSLLSGQTVEDVRRNSDKSITLYTDKGRVVSLCVRDGEIVPDNDLIITGSVGKYLVSERLCLLRAFQDYMISYAVYDERGNIDFFCQAKPHNTQKYAKALGSRKIKMTHKRGIIDDFPQVSAIIGLTQVG